MISNSSVKPRLAGAWTCRKRHALLWTLGRTTMHSHKLLRILLVSLYSFASPVFATTPLFDKVEIDGEQGNLHQKGKGWLDLPHSERLQEIRFAERCSAIGGPRGEYRVEGGSLWLHSLYRCAGKIEINEIYPEHHQPILASWVTGDLIAEVGKPVCRSSKGQFFIYETEITMQVEAGAVNAMQRKSNAGHPDCRNAP
jgi:hypothetical protein